MSNTKTSLLINDYIETNYLSIEQARLDKSFTWKTVCDEIGIPHNYSEHIRSRYRQFRQRRDENVVLYHTVDPYYIPSPITITASDSIDSKYIYSSGTENKDKGTKEFVFTADRIPTEEEIVEHFNIDLKKYRISQIWHKTTPGGKYSISISLLQNKVEEAADYSKAFLKFLNDYNGTSLIPVEGNTNLTVEDGMLLISLADVHIGNAQVPEYLAKIKIAISKSLELLKDSLIEEVVLLNLGDFFHTDNSKNTTYSGTQLDPVTCFEDSFTLGLDFFTDIIEYVSYHAKKVTVINIKGNHSQDTEYILGETLKRIFKNFSNVNIINNKEYRTYYKYHNSGLLLSHGDKGMERLPLTFATEGKEVFTSTDNHYIFTGHLHHSSGKQFINDRKEYAGIEVRVLSAPTSTDKWHSDQAFQGNKKQILSFYFDKVNGKTAEFYFPIE